MTQPRSVALAVGLALAFLVPATAGAAAKPAKKKPAPKGAKVKPDVAAEKEMEAGGTLFAEGKYEAALPHFEKARDLIPEASGPYRALGHTYKHLDRLLDAREAFERYATLKGSGPTVDEAFGEIKRIDEELARREGALRPKPDPKPPKDDPTTLPPPPGGGKIEDPSPTPSKGGGGFGPLRIVGIGGMVAGAGAAGVGVFFSLKWLSARKGFSTEYDLVSSSLSVEPGVTGTLYVCDDADYEMFTAESRTLLEPARAHCRNLSRYRILGPVLAAGGVVLLGAGLALFLVGGNSGKSDDDDYASEAGPLRAGPVSFDVAPLPGGLFVSGTARF